MPWRNYAAGHSKSCGKCNYIYLSELNGKQYGNLQIEEDKDELVSKNYKAIFICSCGSKKKIVLKSVLNGLTKSCGCLLIGKNEKFIEHALLYKGPQQIINRPSINPNVKLNDWWQLQQFGRLKIIQTVDKLSIKSEKKLQCQCACGNMHHVRAEHLTSGRTKSCGKCSLKAAKWWEETKILSYPTNLKEFKQIMEGSSLEPLEFNKLKPKTKCLYCSKIFTPRFYDIFLKQIKSCGCINSKITQPTIKLASYIPNQITIEYEKSINGWDIDIFLPDFNLGIDLHGLRYHSNAIRDNKSKDIRKFRNLSHTIDYLVIYEDEVRIKKDWLKSFLTEKTKSSNPKILRPQKCSLQQINYKQTVPLYEQYHYLGPRAAKLHLGLYYNEKLVAAISIHTPSRQSNHDYEIVRMCRNPNYRIHGIWSYLMSKLPEYGVSGSIISFSDNRISNGNVYSIIGFKFSGDIKSDYWYTNLRQRFHKSKMRKTKKEKLSNTTEENLRLNQGFYKIWDFGKKKWDITL